jgi:glycosyltransferase involved in cell wall biosynthesis
MKKKAYDLGIMHLVIFAGRQSFVDVPKFIGCFHIGLVSASSALDFHYSPLKLREYLAVGCAVIAPRAGDLPNLFTDGKDLLFYEVGAPEDLVKKMSMILRDSNLHQKLVQRSLEISRKEGAWIHELSKVAEVLGLDGKIAV